MPQRRITDEDFQTEQWGRARPTGDYDTLFDPYDFNRGVYEAANEDPYAGFRRAVREDPFMGAGENDTLFDPYSQAAKQQSSPPPQPQFDWQAAMRKNEPYADKTPAITGLFSRGSTSTNASRPPVVNRPRPQAITPQTQQQQTQIPTAQPPQDFAALLSGAAQRGGSAFGDFGASTMPSAEERARTAQQAQAPKPMTFGETKIPQYDYGPMQRYQEYLKSEPNKEDYKPGKWGTALNALSAGFQAMDSKNLGSGIQLYDTLRDRPYQEALKQWQGKGGRYQADATMAETRYKNESANYDKRVDNARQAYTTHLTERGVALKEAEFMWKMQEALDKGYQQFNQDGKVVLGKVVDGKMQYVPTGMDAERLTALQQLEQKDQDRKESRWRHVTPSGSARLGAQTSIFNSGNTIEAASARQRAGFDFTREQSDRTQDRIDNRVGGVVGGRPVQGPTASALMDPLTTITQGYKEFNSPEVVKITKDSYGKPNVQLNDDAKAKEYIKKLSGGDPAKAAMYYQRWLDMKSSLGVQ